MPSTYCNPQGPRGPLKILVADDSVALRTALGGLLRGFGHAVEVVANGLEAVEAAARQAYDVVFLDVQMPEMGGFEAALSIRRGLPGGCRARIVGFSGEEEDRESFEAAGMDEFLAKPVRRDDLARVLGHLVLP